MYYSSSVLVKHIKIYFSNPFDFLSYNKLMDYVFLRYNTRIYAYRYIGHVDMISEGDLCPVLYNYICM